MRLMKFLASAVFSLIIILAIGGYVAVRSFDLNKYKVYVEDIASRELGRQLKINGDASVGISLIPTVIVNDIELANASWAQNPQMIKLKQAEIKFALMPLLKKQIVIDKVILDAPEIYLEKSATGENNWAFGANAVQKEKTSATQYSNVSAAQTSGAAMLAGMAIGNVSIQNGRVEYYDAKSNQLTNLQINNISLSAPSAKDKISVAFDVLYNQQKISGDASLGSLAQLLAQDEAFPFLIDAQALGISAKVNGSVADATTSPRYAVMANVYNPAGNLNAPETTLETRIDGDIKGLTARIETLNIVNNLITGNAEVRWDSKVPQINADLQSAKINLQNFQSKSNFANAWPSLIAEAQALDAVPNTPIPYDLLNLVDANLKVTIGQLVLAPGMNATNVNASAVLKGGRLAVKPLKLNFGGGEINADLSVDAAAKSVSIKAVSQKMLLQNLHKEFMVDGPSDFGFKQGGNIDMDINLSGSGATYRQLMQNMKGQVVGIVGESVVQTGGLQFVGGNFITQLLQALHISQSKAADLDLTCAVVRADVAGGKVSFPNGIAVDSKQLTVVSDGKVNLLNDDISFTIAPSLNKLAKGNIAQALASFIKVGGTIEDPKIRIDNQEALKTVVGVATGGVAYLGSQMVLNGDGSPCYTALQGTAYAARYPKPTGVKATTQDVYNDTTKQIKDGVKDLKNTAKDILGMFKTPKN